MDPKEKYKDFNQWVFTLKNKIPKTSRPTNDITVEFYTTTLPSFVAMFVKREEKIPFSENFEEAIKVEKDLLSVHGKTKINEEKLSNPTKKSSTHDKNHSEKKEQDFMNMESMSKIIKKLFNNVVDLKKMASKNTSMNTTKPSFSQYQNAPTRKTLTLIGKAHFG